MGYSLYFSKQECVLIIKTLEQTFDKYVPIVVATDVVSQLNTCYYICNKKGLLEAKALELKLKWKVEAEKRLQSIIDIII